MKRYAIVTCNNTEDRRQDLKQAILSRDIYALLQVYAEGIDFMEPLPDMVRYIVLSQCKEPKAQDFWDLKNSDEIILAQVA